MRQLFAYAQLLRLPNTFTAMADIFLGALVTGLLAERWQVLICLLLASTLLYWSGMIWNDYFDLEQDRLERPGRPLASGRIALRTALFMGVGCMLGGVLFAGLADRLSGSPRWCSLYVACALVAAIFLYDGVFKKTWVGPVCMGMCRFLNIVLGLTILGTWPPMWGWLLAVVIGSYIAGVTWFASTEARNSSQPRLIGAAIVMLVSLALALTVPAMALEIMPNAQPSIFFPYLLSAFGAYLGVAVVQAIKQPLPQRVQPAIKRAILGLVVLDALLASALVGNAGFLLLLLLVPGMLLGRWLYST